MLKISNAPTEGKCPRCTHYQKQNARLKRAFIEADDESVRRYIQYEDKISKFKAEKEWLFSSRSSASTVTSTSIEDLLHNLVLQKELVHYQ